MTKVQNKSYNFNIRVGYFLNLMHSEYSKLDLFKILEQKSFDFFKSFCLKYKNCSNNAHNRTIIVV